MIKLLQFKTDSEAKIKNLEKEVQSLKKKKDNEMTCKPNHLSEVESLTENFVKLNYTNFVKEIETSIFLKTRIMEQALSI